MIGPMKMGLVNMKVNLLLGDQLRDVTRKAMLRKLNIISKYALVPFLVNQNKLRIKISGSEITLITFDDQFQI
jgi:hypothetical protein